MTNISFLNIRVSLVALILLIFCPLHVAAGEVAGPIIFVIWSDPPDIVDEHGKYSGPQATFGLEVLRRSGLAYQIRFGSFGAGYDELLRNPAAFGVDVVRSQDREHQLSWLVQTARSPELFVTTSGRKKISSFDEARALKAIVVEKQTYWHHELQRRGFRNLIEVYEANNSARVLRSGRANAWFTGADAALFAWAAEGFEASDLLVGEPVAFDDTYMVAHKDFPHEWKIKLIDAVKAMAADGTIQRLSAQDHLQVQIPTLEH
jgi:ABC-type amino acid transport substrate-binding protein